MRELAPLVDALDSTLASLKRAFNREQKFIADAAHELKTAVAILKSTLQLLVCRPRTSVEYKEGLERSLGGLWPAGGTRLRHTKPRPRGAANRPS